MGSANFSAVLVNSCNIELSVFVHELSVGRSASALNGSDMIGYYMSQLA
jgi:hypothetical protein